MKKYSDNIPNQDGHDKTIQELVQPAYNENLEQQSSYSLEQVRNFISNWLDKPKEVAEWMINKYGMPQEATNQRLIWHNNGIWKYSIVENAEIPHDFPYPHSECLTQAINFHIDVDSCSSADLYEDYVVSRTKGNLSSDQIIPEFCRDIAWFNGSLIMDRTKGEMLSRGESEPYNYLNINLAKDIICGSRTVENARSFYAEVAYKLKETGDATNYTQGLLFVPPADYVGDPGFDIPKSSKN